MPAPLWLDRLPRMRKGPEGPATGYEWIMREATVVYGLPFPGIVVVDREQVRRLLDVLGTWDVLPPSEDQEPDEGPEDDGDNE